METGDIAPTCGLTEKVDWLGNDQHGFLGPSCAEGGRVGEIVCTGFVRCLILGPCRSQNGSLESRVKMLHSKDDYGNPTRK